MTDRDRLFINEYLIDFDARNAAIRAGYKPGAAKHACEWIDADNPTKPLVRAEIEKALAIHSRRCGVKRERVIAELAKIAFADISQAIDIDSGRVREDADPASLAALSSIKVSSKGMEYSMSDKRGALELLGRYLGMWDETIKLEGAVPVIIDDTGDK